MGDKTDNEVSGDHNTHGGGNKVGGHQTQHYGNTYQNVYNLHHGAILATISVVFVALLFSVGSIDKSSSSTVSFQRPPQPPEAGKD